MSSTTTLSSWEWKQEPVSPLPSEESLLSDEDVALYGTTLEQIDPKVELEFVSCESKAEVASKLLEGLEQLEDLDEFIKGDFDEWIKDEPFSNWLEEKMLPMFEDMDPARSAHHIMALKSEQALVPDTQSLLQEFENVFDAVEMTHGTLTPPQSPPYQPPLFTTLEPLVTPQPPPSIYNFTTVATEKQPIYPPTESNVLDYTRLPPQQQSQLDFQEPPTPQTDVAHELAVVDELIRTRAEDMINYPSSPGSSSSSSSSSNFGDCSSDDPEWIPETIEPQHVFDPLLLKSASLPQRKRSKPYSRNEDKKSRKKEQNKNAATRYRMKKKAEVEEILEEERLLAKDNDGLETQITDLQREIKYLKGLMRELFKAKGLIN